MAIATLPQRDTPYYCKRWIFVGLTLSQCVILGVVFYRSNASLVSAPVLEHQLNRNIYNPEHRALSALLRREQAVQKIADLRASVADIYSQYIIPHEPVALIALPKIWNLGDSFIWAGQKSVLDMLGINLVYSCLHKECSFSELRRVIGNGTILIHGETTLESCRRNVNANNAFFASKSRSPSFQVGAILAICIGSKYSFSSCSVNFPRLGSSNFHSQCTTKV